MGDWDQMKDFSIGVLIFLYWYVSFRWGLEYLRSGLRKDYHKDAAIYLAAFACGWFFMPVHLILRAVGRG